MRMDAGCKRACRPLREAPLTELNVILPKITSLTRVEGLITLGTKGS